MRPHFADCPPLRDMKCSCSVVAAFDRKRREYFKQRRLVQMLLNSKYRFKGEFDHDLLEQEVRKLRKIDTDLFNLRRDIFTQTHRGA